MARPYKMALNAYKIPSPEQCMMAPSYGHGRGEYGISKTVCSFAALQL